jgi:nitronate monooxygenase
MSASFPPIKTAITDMLGIDYPIIAAPMFLVSNEDIVTEAGNAGAIGGAPSLNWRPASNFEEAVIKIKAGTDKPYAINLIVNRSNLRLQEDLAIIVKHKVPVVITSLGNPAEVIKAVHAYGGKVFCDVTTLEYGLKVQEAGCDAVIAVSSGAGGHAGSTSPLVLLPYLKKNLHVPVIAAGGIATGEQMLAAFILGADAVQIGTRFIATHEAKVSLDYKEAIVKSGPQDIVLTSRISGTPAAVINTPYIQKMGLDMSAFEKALRKNKYLRNWAKLLRYMRGTSQLEEAAQGVTWKTVWSAGQGVGLIEDILSVEDVVQNLVKEYWQARDQYLAR